MSLLIKHLCRFGEFTLDTDQEVLLRGGRPVSVTPKVFDMLLVLVEEWALTKQTLYRWEKSGKIRRARRLARTIHRIYTDEDIQEIKDCMDRIMGPDDPEGGGTGQGQ